MGVTGRREPVLSYWADSPGPTHPSRRSPFFFDGTGTLASPVNATAFVALQAAPAPTAWYAVSFRVNEADASWCVVKGEECGFGALNQCACPCRCSGPGWYSLTELVLALSQIFPGGAQTVNIVIQVRAWWWTGPELRITGPHPRFLAVLLHSSSTPTRALEDP